MLPLWMHRRGQNTHLPESNHERIEKARKEEYTLQNETHRKFLKIEPEIEVYKDWDRRMETKRRAAFDREWGINNEEDSIGKKIQKLEEESGIYPGSDSVKHSTHEFNLQELRKELHYRDQFDEENSDDHYKRVVDAMRELLQFQEEMRRKEKREEYRPLLKKLCSWSHYDYVARPNTHTEQTTDESLILDLLERLPKNPPKLDMLDRYKQYKLWMDKSRHKDAEARFDSWTLFDYESGGWGYAASMNELYENLQYIACPEGLDWNSSKLNWEKYNQIRLHVGQYLYGDDQGKVYKFNGMLGEKEIQRDYSFGGAFMNDMKGKDIDEMSKDRILGRPLIFVDDVSDTYVIGRAEACLEAMQRAKDVYNRKEIPSTLTWILKFNNNYNNNWNVRLPTYSPKDIPKFVDEIFRLHYEGIEKAREIEDETKRSYAMLECTVRTVRRLHMPHFPGDGSARTDIFGVLPALLLQLQREFNCGFCCPILPERPDIFGNCTPIEKLMEVVLHGMHAYNELFQ